MTDIGQEHGSQSKTCKQIQNSGGKKQVQKSKNTRNTRKSQEEDPLEHRLNWQRQGESQTVIQEEGQVHGDHVELISTRQAITAEGKRQKHEVAQDAQGKDHKTELEIQTRNSDLQHRKQQTNEYKLQVQDHNMRANTLTLTQSETLTKPPL